MIEALPAKNEIGSDAINEFRAVGEASYFAHSARRGSRIQKENRRVFRIFQRFSEIAK
jgi:hypothetical protein